MTSIVLHGVSPSAAIRPADVFFAFGDGVFTYDCQTCRSQCCRGFGYNVGHPTELPAQVGARRAVTLFLRKPAGGGVLSVNNCGPGCFFLQEDGRCGVQAESGFEAKPETCRLFPFNQFRLAGSFLIVTPHPRLCPLSVTQAGQRDLRASGHAELLRGLGLRGIYAEIPRTAVTAVAEAVELERQVVALSETSLGAGDVRGFCDAQAALAAHRRVPSADSFSAANVIAAIERALGMAPSAAAQADPRLARVMIATTPVLRSRLRFPPSTEGVSLPLVTTDRLPHAMMVVHTLGAFALDAGLPEVTYQTLSRLLQDYLPLVRLLAQADRIMVWHPSAGVDLRLSGDSVKHEDYLRVARALLPVYQVQRRKPLADLLVEEVTSRGEGRLAALNRIASRVLGRILPLDVVEAGGPRARSVRPVMQQLALRLVPDEVLTQAALARSGRG